jgi:hypothetical protein
MFRLNYGYYGYGAAIAVNDINQLESDLIGFMNAGRAEAMQTDWCKSHPASCNYDHVTEKAIAHITSIAKMPEVQSNPINGVQPLIDYASNRMFQLWNKPAPETYQKFLDYLEEREKSVLKWLADQPPGSVTPEAEAAMKALAENARANRKALKKGIPTPVVIGGGVVLLLLLGYIALRRK